MKGLALTVALLALPASAGAQALTLNCHYEYEISNSYDPERPDREGPMSGAFSALVRMSKPQLRGKPGLKPPP